MTTPQYLEGVVGGDDEVRGGAAAFNTRAVERKSLYVSKYNDIKYANEKEFGKLIHGQNFESSDGVEVGGKQLTAQRKRYREILAKQTEVVGGRSDYMPTKYGKADRERREKKKESRMHYNKRFEERKTVTGVNIISPYLDKLQINNMTDSERLVKYSKHRFCQHKKRLNWIYNPLGTRYYQVGCDHEKESIPKSKPQIGVCTICCESQKFYKVDRDCDCEVYICDKCLFQFYKFNGEVENFCICKSLHKTIEVTNFGEYVSIKSAGKINDDTQRKGVRVLVDYDISVKPSELRKITVPKYENLEVQFESDLQEYVEQKVRSFANVAANNSANINYNNNDFLKKKGWDANETKFIQNPEEAGEDFAAMVREFEQTLITSKNGGALTTMKDTVLSPFVTLKEKIKQTTNTIYESKKAEVIKEALHKASTTFKEYTELIAIKTFKIAIHKFLDSLNPLSVFALVVAAKERPMFVFLGALVVIIYYWLEAIYQHTQHTRSTLFKAGVRQGKKRFNRIRAKITGKPCQEERDEYYDAIEIDDPDKITYIPSTTTKESYLLSAGAIFGLVVCRANSNITSELVEWRNSITKAFTDFRTDQGNINAKFQAMGSEIDNDHTKLNKMYLELNTLKTDMRNNVRTTIDEEFGKLIDEYRADRKKIRETALHAEEMMERMKDINDDIYQRMSKMRDEIFSQLSTIKLPQAIVDQALRIDKIEKIIYDIEQHLAADEYEEEEEAKVDDEEEECGGFECRIEGCKDWHPVHLRARLPGKNFKSEQNDLTRYPNMLVFNETIECMKPICNCAKTHVINVSKFCEVHNLTYAEFSQSWFRAYPLNTAQTITKQIIEVIEKEEEKEKADANGCMDFLKPILGIQVGRAWTNYIKPFLATFSLTVGATRNMEWIIQKVKDLFGNLWGFTSPAKHLRWKLLNDETFKALVNDAFMLKNGEYEFDDDYIIRKTRAKENLMKVGSYINENGLSGEVIFSRFYANMAGDIETPRRYKDRRQEPFCLRIFGAPGVGKSMFWPLLVSGIVKKSTVAEVEDVTYTRTVNDPYWTALNDKAEIVLYDDFGQNKEEVDYNELIALISTASFIPPMPSLDNPLVGVKGVQARPKVVVLLTNIKDPGTGATTIRDPAALARRSHLSFEMIKNAEVFEDPEKGLFKLLKAEVTDEVIYDKMNKTMTMLEARKLTEYAYNLHHIRLERARDNTNAKMEKVMKNSANFSPLMDQVLKFGAATGVSIGSFAAVSLAHYIAERCGIDCFINTNRFVYSAFLAIVMGVCTAYTFYNMMTAINDINGATPDSGTTKDRHVKVQVVRNSGLDDVRNVVLSNVCKLTDLQTYETLNGIAIKGHTIMAPAHFLRKFKEGEKFTVQFTNTSAKYIVIFEPKRLFIDIKRDFGLYQVKITEFNARRNIMNHFWTGDYALEGRLATFLKSTIKDETITTSQSFEIKISGEQVEYDDDELTMRMGNYKSTFDTIRQVIGVGQYASGASTCGNPVLLEDVSKPHILGYHVASTASGKGFFVLINREALTNNLMSLEEQLLEKNIELVEPAVKDSLEGKIQVNGSNELIGRTVYTVKTPTKTTLTKSTIHGLLQEPTTEPSVLSDYDRRISEEYKGICLIQNGVDKYKGLADYAVYDQDIVNESGMAMARQFYNKGGVIFPEFTLDWDTTINGCHFYPYMDKIDMSTSAGYPWSIDKIRKKDLFEFDGIKYFMRESIQQQADDLWKKWG